MPRKRLRGRNRYWTEQRIVTLIKDRHKKGKDLSYTGMYADGLGGMYVACRGAFGSYREAVEAASIPIAVTNRRHADRSWTPEQISTEIRRREEQNLSLAHTDVKNENGSLWNAANRQFNGWREAVEAAGVDYEKHIKDWEYDKTAGSAFENEVYRLLLALERNVKRKKRIKYPYEGKKYIEPDFYVDNSEYWEAKLNANAPHVKNTIQLYLKVIPELTIVYLLGEPHESEHVGWVSAYELLKEALGKISSANSKAFARRFREIGERTNKKSQLDSLAEFWTKKQILDSIRKVKADGGSLLAKDVRMSWPKLYGAVMSKKYFGSWYSAVTTAGFDGDALQEQGQEEKRRNRTKYTKVDCLEQLLCLHSAGHTLSATNLARIDRFLFGGIRRQFGQLDVALEAAGIEPTSQHGQIKWSKQKVVDALKTRQRSGLQMSASAVSSQNANLYSAAKRHFGDIWSAAKAANVSLENPKYGAPWFDEERRFSEKLFGEVLQHRFESGLGMAHRDVLKDDVSLYRAARKYFGAWYDALEKFGFPVGEIRQGSTRNKGFCDSELGVDHTKVP